MNTKFGKDRWTLAVVSSFQMQSPTSFNLKKYGVIVFVKCLSKHVHIIVPKKVIKF